MQAKVWNKNIYPFKQKFGSDLIEIPAGGFVEMEYHDAVRFKSKMSPVEKDGGGQQLPQSFKMIEVEPIKSPHEGQEITAFKSMIDGSLHPSKEALAAYEASMAHGAATDVDGAKIVNRGGRPRKEAASQL